MPIYEYVCTDCGKKFDLLRSYSKADEPAECKNCHSFNSKRALSLFNAKSEGRSITSSGCDSCNGGSCGSCHH